MCNLVFTRESKIDWAFAFLNWVFIEFVLGPYYVLYNIDFSNWVLINCYAFCYPLFENQFGISELFWVNMP